MGAIVDGAVEDENGYEDDALLTLSDLCKLFPLPSAPNMSRETTTTYGAMSPLWFGRGDEHVAQRAETVAQHGRDHTGNFTQVQAAARRKTLLLLWWIDGGMEVVKHNTLAR